MRTCVLDPAGDRELYLNERARAWVREHGLPGAARFDSVVHRDDGDTARWRQRLVRLADGEVLARQVRLRGAGGRYEVFRMSQSLLARTAGGKPAQVLAVYEPVDG